jgi:hypothetical protein
MKTLITSKYIKKSPLKYFNLKKIREVEEIELFYGLLIYISMIDDKNVR